MRRRFLNKSRSVSCAAGVACVGRRGLTTGESPMGLSGARPSSRPFLAAKGPRKMAAPEIVLVPVQLLPALR